MNILVFLPDVALAQQWSESMVKNLSARVRVAKDEDQFYKLLHIATFDAALVSIDFPHDVGNALIDLLLKAHIPTVVHTAVLSDMGKAIYARRAIMDYILGVEAESLTQAIDIFYRLERNQKTNVLVVDDSAAFRGQISMLLKTQGVRVLTAEDGQQALDILAKEKISLMLTDFNMPNMDGLALTKAARQLYGKHHLAIVVLTASTESSATDFLKYGANDFLSKPFTREELTCRVNQNLDLIYLMSDMQDMAHRDFLTKLYNRRYFLEQGSRFYDMAKSSGRPMVVAMLDIDHFKRINDGWGHDAGDEAIRTLARLLQQRESKDFVVARLGGEEFALFMQGEIAMQAEKALEKLRAEVEATAVEVAAGNIAQTISIGWVLGDAYVSLGAALTAADANLYVAKESGRNRVIHK